MSSKDVQTLLGAIEQLRLQHAEFSADVLARLEKIERPRNDGDIDPRKAYSCEQAGRFLGLSRHTIWQRVRAGLIEVIPQPAGTNTIRIRGKTLLALLGDDEAA